MSLVGPPRYLAHELTDEFGRHAARISSVKPGITDPWQVLGRSNLSLQDRIPLDEADVRNRVFRYDLPIVFRTIKVVMLRDGAH
jgi:lipopolysaccharide/colanic/teichoic acid biosynthesis glycosyltransferase